MKAHTIIKNKPYLNWSTVGYSNLSDKNVVESVLSYGNWKDFLDLTKALGFNKTKSLFFELTKQKRCNLKPQTINYFLKYFTKHDA